MHALGSLLPVVRPEFRPMLRPVVQEDAPVLLAILGVLLAGLFL